MSAPTAYCFYQVFEPRPTTTIAFEKDYLLYAIKGSIRLGVSGRQWTLPPSYAAWIPANTAIDVAVMHPMTCCSVLFDPGFVEHMPGDTVVFTMTPMARDMIHFSRRWGPDADNFDGFAESYFRSIAFVCVELAASPSDVWQPAGRSREVSRALTYTESHLAEPLTFADVASAAGASERTLLRRFGEEVGLTWQQTLRRLRMVRAVELLSNTEDAVIQVAYGVGYASLSAFTNAFRDFTGLTPTQFRARHRSGWGVDGETLQPELE
ncbi:MAG: AraC family transcriptional regulator [Pseudomonadota bacterium]